MTQMIGLTPAEQDLWSLFQPTVEDCGLELVRVKLLNHNGQVLEIMVDGQKGVHVTLDQCAEVSRRLGRLLDVEDPINGNYNLEVSSPGVERPLVTLEALQEHVGQNVLVRLHHPTAEGRKLKGELLSVGENSFVVETHTMEHEIVFSDVREIQKRLSQEEVAKLMKASKKK